MNNRKHITKILSVMKIKIATFVYCLICNIPVCFFLCLAAAIVGASDFEAGVLSSNHDFVKNAAEQFDSVWMGAHCKGCKRKKFCGDPIGI